jgi:hypothetical protein
MPRLISICEIKMRKTRRFSMEGEVGARCQIAHFNILRALALGPPSALLVKKTIIHELGSDLQAEPQEVSVEIQPSKLPTRVVVKSEVRTEGAQKLRSAAYMATVRRRETKTLAHEVAALIQHARREDFGVCTFPVTERLKRLLATLSAAEQEGNTREILRRIRDSIQNGGWEVYRKPEVRNVVASLFDELSKLEEVVPGHVKMASKKIEAVGLDSVAHLFDLKNDTSDASE